jgi:hypothetical protein
MLPDTRKRIVLLKILGFDRLSFWREQHLDEGKNGALVQ